MNRLSDTIAAIATPPGEGAISVVRTSGPEAIALVDKVFRGSHTLSKTPGYMVRYGCIVDAKNEAIDHVLASVFRSPHSYTGEDSVEISCHGGVLITRRLMSVLVEAGARRADPGEFTKRAFLNGRIDLSQAEAVADLIKARSERTLRNSSAQLNGVLTNTIRLIRGDLLDICSLLEIQLDFSEEDLPVESAQVLEGRILDCRKKLLSLLHSFRAGKVIRDGMSVAIIGRPNAGKSSIFNRLLVSDRSIVSPVPGTTRDFLEESIAIDGALVKLIDTAGLRAANDEVEAEGIYRTKEAIKKADIVLLVIDSTQNQTDEGDISLLGNNTYAAPDLLVVRNKVDRLAKTVSRDPTHLYVSALTGEGISELRDRIRDIVTGDSSSTDSDEFICSARHAEAIESSLKHIDDGLNSVRSGITGEFVAADLKLASDHLACITGEITNDVILNSIFSKFCIGK